MRTTLRYALLGGLAIGLVAPAQSRAQTSTTPTPMTPPATSPATPGAPPVVSGPGTSTSPGIGTRGMTTPQGGRADADERRVVDAAALEEGANSFTEGQTRSRLEDAGFSVVEGLRKDDRGFWRGQAMRNGQVTEVAMDFRGRIAAGPNLANLGRGAATTGTTGTRIDPSATVPSSPTPSITGARPDTTARPDGTPGNPPSTAVGRAVDRMQGDTPRADGTPGNPPGTAAGRATDRATGSNMTGTNPAPGAAPVTPAPANR